MKKPLLISFVVLLVISTISSCTKTDDSPLGDYVCHCDINASSGKKSIDIPLNGKTKADAVTTCASTEDSYNTAGNTATCNLQ
jgi:hypothetical protein